MDAHCEPSTGERRCVSAEPLPRDLVEALARPEAYPDDPSASEGVETLQTHLSHLYLTPTRVVKLRKAVELSFVDFSTRAARIEDCRHEVALNRRLAPDVYLGVAPIEQVDGRCVVRDDWLDVANPAPLMETRECVVVMRRLEAGGDALSRLERGALAATDLDPVAATLARFHDRVGLGRPAPWAPEAWWEHCYRPVGDTLASLAQTHPAEIPPEEIDALAAATRSRFEALRGPLEQRRREGLAVEGHGDVHLQHVWFESGRAAPVLIDCLEFAPHLRRIDAASEVAFLAMDLAYRGRRDLGEHFLRRYATARDDFGLYALVDAYQSYRAAVRAKVAALAAVDSRIPPAQRKAAEESTRRHLALAAACIEPARSGALVLVCGTVGVGKSTAAEALAERSAGVVVSSDRTRKRLAGLGPTERGEAALDQGLYAADRTQAVYRGLLERAEPIVGSGRVAILDATFARVVHREQALVWARERGVDAFLLQVECEEAVARDRVQRRREHGTDPSDAGPELVATSRARFEPLDAWPRASRYTLHSDRQGEDAALDALASKLDARA
jgi:aminoglycoside phosphotransferase family enzyme/predicted kinase